MHKSIAIIVAVGIALAAGTAFGKNGNEKSQSNHFRVKLEGNQEVPPLSTPASGSLEIHLAPDGNSFSYEVRYDDLVGNVTQAHVHFGRAAINGGVMVFFCSNVGAPVTTPACPGTTSGAVSGTVGAADVIGPAGQGIAPGEFAEVLEALRSGTAYGNVHSSVYPNGEIRGNIR